jgi:outer membrane protein
MIVCAPLTANAQGKIAVLDFRQAIINTDFSQQKIKEMLAEPSNAANIKELDKLKKEHDEVIAKYQKDLAIMSKEQQQTQTKIIQEKRADIEHVARKLQTAEQALVQALERELQPKVQLIVAEIIKTEGIGLLLNRQAAMHVDTGFSITAKVTDKLNQGQGK